MNPGLHVVLCGMLTFGVPLVFAIYELVTMRRAGSGSMRRRVSDPTGPTPQPRGGEAPLRPLPACLIPQPRQVAPDRVLELV